MRFNEKLNVVEFDINVNQKPFSSYPFTINMEFIKFKYQSKTKFCICWMFFENQVFHIKKKKKFAGSNLIQ